MQKCKHSTLGLNFRESLRAISENYAYKLIVEKIKKSRKEVYHEFFKNSGSWKDAGITARQGSSN